MRDMTRADAQDLLPDLLHGRLSDGARAEVERIIASDPELAAELSLLQRVRAAHAALPTVDMSRILAVLPPSPAQGRVITAPPAVAQVDELAARRTVTRAPRIFGVVRAAAVLVLLGGGAVIARRDMRTPDVRVASSAPAESLAPIADTVQLGLGAPTDDLTVDQLRALEQDIQALDGVPSAEPDAMTNLADGEGA